MVASSPSGSATAVGHNVRPQGQMARLKLAGLIMNCFEIQESGYTGQVWAAAGYSHPVYFYSVSRTPQRERLFDGAAGDVAEALSTMRAHIRYLAFGDASTPPEE